MLRNTPVLDREENPSVSPHTGLTTTSPSDSSPLLHPLLSSPPRSTLTPTQGGCTFTPPRSTLPPVLWLPHPPTRRTPPDLWVREPLVFLLESERQSPAPLKHPRYVCRPEILLSKPSSYHLPCPVTLRPCPPPSPTTLVSSENLDHRRNTDLSPRLPACHSCVSLWGGPDTDLSVLRCQLKHQWFTE